MRRFDEIAAAVLAETDGITLEHIKAYDRSRRYSVPRHLLMYFLMKEGNTCIEVGKELNRTHVTVMHGYRAVLTWLEYPSQYTNEVELYERVKTRLSKQQEQ